MVKKTVVARKDYLSVLVCMEKASLGLFMMSGVKVDDIQLMELGRKEKGRIHLMITHPAQYMNLFVKDEIIWE